MSSTNKSRISKIIAYVAIVLLLVAACGTIAFFTNGFTSDFKTFYVENNDGTYLTNTENFVLSPDSENRFNVKYTFGALNDKISGYSVKIIPDISHENDFDFTVDGETYSFGAESDLTKGFELNYYDDYFTIDGNFTMQEVLQRLYPDSAVSVNAESVNPSVDNFILVIFSYNGSASISIGFHNYVAPTEVVLQDTLIFEEAFDGTIHAK